MYSTVLIKYVVLCNAAFCNTVICDALYKFTFDIDINSEMKIRYTILAKLTNVIRKLYIGTSIAHF